MIAVTIQPHSATICTQGCTLIFTILLKQVIAHENFIVIIFQSFCGLKQRGRKDDLIEQIPFAAIEQSAHSLIFQRHPPGVVKVIFSHIFDVFLCPQYGKAQVHRIIVEVAHDNQFQVRIRTHQRVLQCLHLHGSVHAYRFRRPPRGPVVDYQADFITRQLAAYNQESTGFVDGISLERSGKHQCRRMGSELFGVIQQRTVDAPFVRSFIMYVSITSGSQFGLANQIVKHAPVLHLRHTDCGRPCRYFITRKFAQHLGQIFQFRTIFLRVPPLCRIRKIFIIVFSRIMNGIKQILKIVKSYAVQPVRMILCPATDRQQQ